MFASNHQLSVTGLKKLFITETLGLSLIFAMYFSDRLDMLTGTIILSGIFLFSCLYLNLIFYFIDKRHKANTSGKQSEQIFNTAGFQKYIRIKCFIKASIFMIFGCLMLVKYVHEQILFDTNTIFIAFLIFLFALPISRAEIEVRGRLCELLYLFVLIPIICTIIYQICTIDFRNFFSIFAERMQPEYTLNFINIIKIFLTTFFSFLILCPWGYLAVGKPIFDMSKTGIKKSIFYTSFFIYIIALIQFIASCMTYHVHPVLSIVISLMIYIATALHYCTPKKRAVKYSPAIAGFIFTGILLLLPAVLQQSKFFTYLSEINFDQLYDKTDKIIDARELESRSFVLSMVVSVQNDEPLYICELADTQTEEISSKYVSVTNLESYMAGGGKPLDFSHIEAILVDDQSLQDKLPDFDFSDNIKEIADTYRIPGSTLIFLKKDFPDTYEHLTKELDAIKLGEVLRTLAKNQEIEKIYTVRNIL